VQGLIVQGRTIQETIEIARDVAKKLIEAQTGASLSHRRRVVRLTGDCRHLMGRLTGFSYRDITRRLKAPGMEFHRQAAGSHEIWHHPATNRCTTIPNHPGDKPEGMLAILKQAGIEPEEFLQKK
jgi:predicted RNA binding protein YcfA (HicA-like mRNA interferase family)